MLHRVFGAIATVALVASAGAQIYFDRGHTILVPTSSIPMRGIVHSNYLNNLSAPVMKHVPNDGFQAMLGSIGGYYPADIRTAYQIPSNGGSGAIAIVDAYNNPTALADFNTFAGQFGLPKETSTDATKSTNKVFQIVYASGTKPSDDPGWAGEIVLDIEWAHAIAPYAKIYLVEAASSSFTDIQAAVAVAKALPGVKEVSMSFGGNEWSSEGTMDADYVQTGVAFFASSGDTGGVQEYPAMSTNVVGVGGTSLHTSDGITWTETAWTGSGGGPSAYLARPSFQNPVSAIVGAKRGCPDISGIADPATGVAVFSTYAIGGWGVYGGTSLACPVNAAIANVRSSFSASSVAENVRNYAALGGVAFRDVTSGTAGAFTAKAGWDYITGCGSPIGLLPSTQAKPNAVAVPGGQGSHTGAGVLADLYTQNGSTWDTLSQPFSATLGQYASTAVLVKFGGAPATFSKIYFYVSGKSTLTATTEVYAYNYVQAKYLLWGSTSFIPTATKTGIYLLNPGPAVQYFDANNTVHLLIRSHTPGNNATAHTLKLDRVCGYGLP